ncbi:MAG: hypothetical protein QOH60_2309 [Mycobacterium sp.]|jgi:hypothetical protein|nr:hypothetical protein [Mycobacterium sp.]
MKAKLALVAALVALASVCSPPVLAWADLAVPQADTPCPSALADAMTSLPDAKVPLVCAAQPSGGYEWKTVTTPYPVSDRWLSYGPELKLHGEGLRDGRIKSGDWVATPQDADAVCRAEQIAVVDAGVVGPPQIDAGAKGKPLVFRIVPQLFSIQMTGYCLWTKVAG